ncbi:putative prophage transcriptional regulator [Candidatus Sodalis pierantonius str. SOPE]|uniref:Putative prophage transcriptional regulator n=1 Tax=Candidatus Sodalis pierantonii str. SOPE TaxID=2342 RepID=W0HPB2_9GAMM|nr:helix-turn-helix domain-containing protein [Candidatus Sodalis pierantonius]AHF73933.1 putative prophage transcriptional regulator [Candidatus Sodalis pierantonius str. SOPE]
MTHQNEDARADWHREIIKAELHKRGVTFRALDIKAGVKQDVVKTVLSRPCPKYEQLVAEVIGVDPSIIWPSRYGYRKNSYMRKVS